MGFFDLLSSITSLYFRLYLISQSPLVFFYKIVIFYIMCIVNIVGPRKSWPFSRLQLYNCVNWARYKNSRKFRKYLRLPAREVFKSDLGLPDMTLIELKRHH